MIDVFTKNLVIYIHIYWLDDKVFSSVSNCTSCGMPIGQVALYLSMQFNKMYLTKPLRKMFSNLPKLDKLDLVADASWRKSLYPQREIPRNYSAWCPTLVGQKKKRKEKKKIPSLVTYLILNQRNCIFL